MHKLNLYLVNMLQFKSKSTLFIKRATYLILPYLSFYVANLFETFWDTHPSSILPFSTTYLGPGCGDSRLSKGTYMSLPPVYSVWSQRVPRPGKRYNPSSISWVCSGGVFPVGHALLWVSPGCLRFTPCLSVSPGTLRRKSFLPPMISFFRSLPRAHDNKWGLEHRSTGKSRASPSGLALSTPQPIVQWPHCYLSNLCSNLPSIMNKIPRYLNSSPWWSSSLSTWSGKSTPFRLKTMASDLEALTLISYF